MSVFKESAVEVHLTSSVRSLGGWAIKLAPTAVGLPDRLILLPGGRAYLVEMKGVGGRLARAQKVVHGKLRGIGFPVVVLWTKEDVDLWLEGIL